MKRVEFENYILKTFNAKKVYPWTKFPSFATFRRENNKCFAICMDITKDKLGFANKSVIQVVNLKCSPFMIGSLIKENGIYPAYHMNKEHWITVVLDNTFDDEKLKFLAHLSYELTANK